MWFTREANVTTAADELFSSSPATQGNNRQSEEDRLWESLLDPPRTRLTSGTTGLPATARGSRTIAPTTAAELFDDVPLDGTSSPEVAQFSGSADHAAAFFGGGGNTDDAGGQAGPEDAAPTFPSSSTPEEAAIGSINLRHTQPEAVTSDEPEARHEFFAQEDWNARLFFSPSAEIANEVEAPENAFDTFTASPEETQHALAAGASAEGGISSLPDLRPPEAPASEQIASRQQLYARDAAFSETPPDHGLDAAELNLPVDGRQSSTKIQQSESILADASSLFGSSEKGSAFNSAADMFDYAKQSSHPTDSSQQANSTQISSPPEPDASSACGNEGVSDLKPQENSQKDTGATLVSCADVQPISVEAKQGAVSCSAEVELWSQSKKTIATGISFLDHMIDQLKSHGQLNLGVIVSIEGRQCQPAVDYCQGSRSRRPHDTAIFSVVGEAIGRVTRRAVGPISTPPTTFMAPLDEALIEVCIALRDDNRSVEDTRCELAPYGDIPRGGRLWIGNYRTSLTPTFWRALARGLVADLALVKVRGRNAHHIVEATFKSFARALRANLDLHSRPLAAQVHLDVDGESATPKRTGARSRTTKETQIDVELTVDNDEFLDALRANPTDNGHTSRNIQVDTGVAFYDELLRALLASCSVVTASIRCRGDVHIDEHHTVEDVAITLGQCLDAALGDRSGCNRMANAVYGGVEVVIDLSNRPHLAWDLGLSQEFLDEEKVMASEMIEHIFASLVTSARLTLHVHSAIRQGPYNGALSRKYQQVSDRSLAIASAKAFGVALRQAIVLDPRRRGAVASSKGSLHK